MSIAVWIKPTISSIVPYILGVLTWVYFNDSWVLAFISESRTIEIIDVIRTIICILGGNLFVASAHSRQDNTNLIWKVLISVHVSFFHSSYVCFQPVSPSSGINIYGHSLGVGGISKTAEKTQRKGIQTHPDGKTGLQLLCVSFSDFRLLLNLLIIFVINFLEKRWEKWMRSSHTSVIACLLTFLHRMYLFLFLLKHF